MFTSLTTESGVVLSSTRGGWRWGCPLGFPIPPGRGGVALGTHTHRPAHTTPPPSLIVTPRICTLGALVCVLRGVHCASRVSVAVGRWRAWGVLSGVSLLRQRARPPPRERRSRWRRVSRGPAATTMKLTMKTLAGKTFTVEAEESETVRPLRRARATRDPWAGADAPVGGRASRFGTGGRRSGRSSLSSVRRGALMCVGGLAAVELRDLRAAG